MLGRARSFSIWLRKGTDRPLRSATAARVSSSARRRRRTAAPTRRDCSLWSPIAPAPSSPVDPVPVPGSRRTASVELSAPYACSANRFPRPSHRRHQRCATSQFAPGDPPLPGQRTDFLLRAEPGGRRRNRARDGEARGVTLRSVVVRIPLVDTGAGRDASCRVPPRVRPHCGVIRSTMPGCSFSHAATASSSWPWPRFWISFSRLPSSPSLILKFFSHS